MSAEVLLEAAALMKSRAEAVQPLGVWIECGWRPDPMTPLINYTASWTPAVALLVATWLEREGKRAQVNFGDPIDDAALAVARAYMGGDA